MLLDLTYCPMKAGFMRFDPTIWAVIPCHFWWAWLACIWRHLTKNINISVTRKPLSFWGNSFYGRYSLNGLLSARPRTHIELILVIFSDFGEEAVSTSVLLNTITNCGGLHPMIFMTSSKHGVVIRNWYKNGKFWLF